MTEKHLGKIDFAEFGRFEQYPFMLGLHLGFSLDGGKYGVCDGGKYTINIDDGSDWKDTEEQFKAYNFILKFTADLLKTAKVTYVSELIGTPVEVTIEDVEFKDFRILTEVL